MAIYHCSYKPISRASGRSAVASAAYRAAERLTNERDGLTHDFTRRSGVEHTEIVLPGDAVSEKGEMVRGSGPEWARERSTLWNAAEAAEKRKDSRVAGEIEIALPHELTAGQRLELTRNFACEVAERYGVAVDFAIHAPHGQTDVRNHHAHVLMTTRRVEESGLGEKSHLEWENRKLKAVGLPSCPEQVRSLRTLWEETANEHLARAGLDFRIDHRSHLDRGLEIEPTQHVGVHATQMERRGKDVSRTRMDAETAQRNAERIRENPEQVLTIITGEKSVFDRRDIARALHRAVDWGHAGQESGEDFQNALAKVMASPALVELRAEQRDELGKVIEPARYSTREMVEIERGMARSADRMTLGRSFGVRASRVEAALDRQDAAIQRAGGKGLSIEQREAIAHVTGPERIAAVVGLAGAGKSTLLSAAREAWEAQGFTVRGAALAGKAAEGLEESAGIASRTLASWEKGWERGFDTLGPRDVFVIDEAGMVGSRQLSRFIQAADQAGAKIVLVGDPEQLQPIGPGAAFRAVAERVGFVELEEIRRQREHWQRAASVDFGRHRTAEGLAAYAERGAIRFEETAEQARAEIVRDVTADMEARPDGSRLVLAHRNADVQALNEAIRAVRKDRGELEGELVYQTSEGERAFAPGERVLFRENNRELGVKNGMLGTVARVSGPDEIDGQRLVVRLDSAQGPGLGRAVSVSMEDYAAVDHGYATTIHKAQGATVDRAYVLASESMDRHLTYVAMTRHRDGAQLYAGRDEFAGRQGGVLVEHGAAPYEHNPENRESYYVTLERADERHTVWGVDLERAMAEAGSQPGERIGLEVTGSEPVRLPDGTQAERHIWQVRNADELAQARLVSQLSRSGAKETTLDYERAAYAERRGIDIRSEIVVPERMREAGREQAAPERGSLVDRAREGLEASRMAWDEHRGTISARGFAERQAERALKERLPGLTAEVGRQAEGLSRAAETLDGLGARVAAQAKALRQNPGREPETGKAKEPETGRELEAPAARPERKRSMFDGLKLSAGRSAADRVMQQEASRDAPAHNTGRDRERAREPERTPAASILPSPSPYREREALTHAVDRYARAWSDAARMQAQDLPILEHQKAALRETGMALDAARPGALNDLHTALRYEPATHRAMTQMQGRERAVQLVAGIEHEARVRQEPELKIERLAKEWNGLETERRQLRGWQHDEARGKVEARMRSLAGELKRDPQLESLMRSRSRELGIAPGSGLDRVLRERNIDRAMEIGIERSRGLGR
jgi:Ti-type conjugative transfer relaxase TraA